uniref:Secreted protein n=1 Tax=Ascaris lumbricoides TaxID=6252 RepID=A0A0M3I8T3_ASCLU
MSRRSIIVVIPVGAVEGALRDMDITCFNTPHFFGDAASAVEFSTHCRLTANERGCPRCNYGTVEEQVHQLHGNEQFIAAHRAIYLISIIVNFIVHFNVAAICFELFSLDPALICCGLHDRIVSALPSITCDNISCDSIYENRLVISLFLNNKNLLCAPRHLAIPTNSNLSHPLLHDYRETERIR